LDEGWREEVPDYALDHHTGRGGRMGRTGEFFATEGTKLERPAVGIDDPYLESFRKAHSGKKPKLACFSWTREASELENMGIFLISTDQNNG
jgi:hypothetical protein